MHANSSTRSLAGSLLTLLIFVLIQGCASVAPTVDGHGPWPTHFHDASRTNLCPGGVVLPVKMDWEKEKSPFEFFKVYPKAQLSGPVVSEGVLFVGSTDRSFYAFDYRTGKVLWEFKAEYFIESTPTVEGDRVCFGSSDGFMRCLDRNTGKELWKYQARSEMISSPLILGERLYFSSSDDRITSLDMNTGEKVWVYTRGTFRTVSARVLSSPAAAADGGKIFNIFSDGALVALDAETGRLLWDKDVAGDFSSAGRIRRTPMVADERVFVIDSTGALLALDVEKGTVLETYDTLEARDFVAPVDGVLVVAGTDRIVAVDRATGSTLWSRELEKSPVATVFAANGELFVISNYTVPRLGLKWLTKTKGYMEVLDMKDGKLLWEKKFPSPVTPNAGCAENSFALFTDQGEVQVFGQDR